MATCPACEGTDSHGFTMAELLYENNRWGTLCLTCGHRWRSSLHGEGDTCPDCGGVALGTAYPEIPELPPALNIILWVEGCIARAENGAILFLDMLAFLRFHGVRLRAEIAEWEGWFHFIAGVRSRLTEEMMAPPETDETRDREEE